MAKAPPRHNHIARDLRTPKYRKRVVPSRRPIDVHHEIDEELKESGKYDDPTDIEQ